jgi:iron complex outermembrane receptor protein
MPPDKFQLSTEFQFEPLSISLNLKKVLPQTRLGEFETKTEGFSVLDINSSYTIHSSSVSHKFIIQLENIFNEVYYNHLSRIKTIMPEKGRSLNIQYRVVF